MFFLTRSALCIGVVAVLLPAPGKVAAWQGMAGIAGAVAVDGVRKLCPTSSDCVTRSVAAAAILASSLDAGLFAQKSQISNDTLTPADRLPAWSGPMLHR